MKWKVLLTAITAVLVLGLAACGSRTDNAAEKGCNCIGFAAEETQKETAPPAEQSEEAAEEAEEAAENAAETTETEEAEDES